MEIIKRKKGKEKFFSFPRVSFLLKKRKAFVITLDVFVAVLIAIAMGLVITNMLSLRMNDKLASNAIANDMLAVLHKKGEFNSYIGMQQQQVETKLLENLNLLPAQYCGNFSITVYDANDFSKRENFQAVNCEKQGDISRVKRIFSDYSKEKFGIAELEVWLK